MIILPFLSTVDTDNEKTSSPRHTQLHPSTRSQQPTHKPDEESTSAGGGNLVKLQSDRVPSSETPAAAHQQLHQKDEFFSQIHWQKQEAEMAGYTAFRDPNEESDSDSSSSGSDSSSDDDINAIRPPPSNVQGNEGLIANFGAFDDRQNPPQNTPTEGKLLDFSFSDDNVPSASKTTNPPPSQATNQFDPWSAQFTSKPDIEVSNLLGLDDLNDSSRVSDVQSKVTAAGAEQFSNQIEKMGKEKTTSDSNQFDPFGMMSSESSSTQKTAFELLMADLGPSLPTPPSQPTPTTPSQTFDPFDPLGTFNQTQDATKVARNTSTPGTSSNFLPVNPPTTQFSSNAFSHSQPNLSGGNGQQTTTSGFGNRGSASHNTSPLNTSPRTSPIPFGSTGNVSQDPFGQFNLQQMTGSRPPPSRQPAPTQSAMAQKPPHPTYTPFYMQKNNTSNSQSQNQNGQNRSSNPSRSNSKSPNAQQPAPAQQRSTSPRQPNYNPTFSAPASKTGTVHVYRIHVHVVSCISIV